MINDDIDAIIQRGEVRTNELNSKYEGLTFEDLSNFKSEASVQQWEGEDFRSGVRMCSDLTTARLTPCCTATEILATESSRAVKTGAEAQLLRRRLLQGCYACRPFEDREGG